MERRKQHLQGQRQKLLEAKKKERDDALEKAMHSKKAVGRQFCPPFPYSLVSKHEMLWLQYLRDSKNAQKEEQLFTREGHAQQLRAEVSFRVSFVASFRPHSRRKNEICLFSNLIPTRESIFNSDFFCKHSRAEGRSGHDDDEERYFECTL